MKALYKTLSSGVRSGIFATVVLALVGFTQVTAQVSTYTFAQSSGTYTPITGGTVLGIPGNDDTGFPTLPIGFNFCYNGAIYTQFGVNSNGWITMGGGAVNNSYTALSTGLNNNVIAAFNFDIQGDGTTGDLQYSTIGTSPNRTLVVQWSNYDAYQSVLNTDNYNFQIRLSESNGQIDVVYGSWTANAFHLAQVGLRGNSNADFSNREVSNGITTWATSTAGAINSSSCESNTGLIPASGQTYTWSQPTAPALAINASFTGVTATGMTVNWEDNSTNEANFFVQRSTDNITFTTVATIPSSSVATTGTPYNYVATGLYNSTLYYWRILAGNANCGGGFLAAQQSTLAGTMCGTYTVGPTGAYTSLTAAFAAVAANGVNCPLVFDLQAAYLSTVETFPISIPFLGNGPTNTITVRPELGATNLSITSAATQTLIFNGAQYITFDGRPGSLGTVRHLTVENTSTTGNAAQFINDGAYNGFNYCTVQGVNTSATSGVLFFSTALTGGIGNSFNTISNCELRDGVTTPANLVYASNFTANVFNTGNTFTNNLFHDWYNTSVVSSAITASTGNTAWTISNNSFYQTASRTFTIGNLNLIVNMASGSGSATGGYIITGNYFGGTAALCGGTAYTSLGAVAHRLIVIQTTTGTGGANSIQGNTIRNFNFTTTSGVTTTNGIWCAINTTGTNAANNIGNVTPNVIGSTTANAQIVTSTSGTGGLTIAYNNSASGAQNFSNNQIGGITANSSAATISSSIVGIQTSSGTSNTISGNTIGSLTQLSSFINAVSTGATGGQVSGIVCSAFNSSLPGNQITNNMVMNLTNQYAGTSTTGYVRGIVTSSGINTITGNTVANLSNAAPQTGTTANSSVIGISQQSTSSGANQTVAQNTISNLVNLSFTGNVQVVGINATGTTLNQTLVYRNSIIGIGSASTGTAVMHGIQIYGGICRVYNNMVNIGVDATGASLTLSHEFNGINKNTANRATVIFNTVNVGGTGVGAGTANTNAFRRILNPTVTPADSVYSNIFTNVRSNGASTGTHYAININNNTNFLANGNVYYGNGTGFQTGAVGATNYASISLWLGGVPGQDLNSFQVDPIYTSSTNLHINNAIQSVLEGRAVVVGNINNDIDNQNRPGPTGSVNGGGVVHDIGADEFDGIPVNVDIGIQVLVMPLASGCHTNCELVRVRIRNYTATALNMALNNVTVNGSTTGPNPQVFTPLVITSGTIAPNGFLDTLLNACYDMSAVGTHVFNASTSTPSDVVTSNNSMTPVSIVIGGGTATATNTTLCFGDSTNVTISGATNGGTFQWQSSPDNLVWTNVPGATTNPWNTGPQSDTMYFRAMVCGTYASVSDTVRVAFMGAPTVTNDTVCGTGSVTLSAVGSNLQWYDAPVAGNNVNTGPSYTTTVSNTTTYYVASSSGTPPSAVTTTFAAGNGSAGNMFVVSALNTITVTALDGHMTTGTATWEIWGRPGRYDLIPGSQTSNAGWTLLGTAANVPAAGLGVPTVLPITLNVTIPAGTDYSFYVTSTGPTVNYTNGTAVYQPHTTNSDFIFREGHGGGYYAVTIATRIWNGRIHYSAGCEGPRTAVTAVVTPAPVVTATSSNNICGSGSSTLIASSSNPTYGYVWSPAGSLNTANGDTVIASPTSPTVYLVTATDLSSGCVDTASVSVGWAVPPAISVTVSNDTVCANTAVLLNVLSTTTNPVIVGTSNTQNTATTYPAPYGQFYWGSRHQMLVTAADLTAAGLVAGNITALSFEIANTNASAPLDNFEIKIGNTAVSALTAFELTPMTSVFTSSSYVPATGLNTHTFSTPFFWDGVSNIIVETCHNNTSFTNNCSFRQTPTAYTSTVYYRADAAGVCGNNAVTASIAQRPNMRFWSTQVWNYSWTPVASVDSAFIANPTGYPTVTGNFVVAVTDSMSGCVSVDSAYVMVNPNPAPAFGADTAICSNTSLMLDGTAGPYTYLWQDSTTNQMYTVNSFGNYSVVVTDSTTGCIGGDTILVGINAAPSFTLGADATVCAGTQVSFSGPAGSYDYQWSNGDSVITITTGTAGTYELAVTDQINGCASSDTVMLTVNAVPVVALGADTTLCSASGSIMLNGPAGAYSYQWNTMDSTQSITVNSTGTYYVVVTDTATSCLAGDTIMVTYNNSPVANLGSDTTFCSANGPITLAGPFGPYDYMWSDMTTGSTTTAGTTGLYYVDVTDSITGCTTADSIMVTVPASPSFTLSDTTFCGTQYTINGPMGPFMYNWSNSATTSSITVTGSGTYSLTVTDSTSGCTGMDSSVVNINTNPTVTASGSDLTPCADDANVMLTGTPAGGTFTGTSVTGSQFDPSIGAGSYNVVYNFTDVNGCSGADTITVVVSACVGIDEQFAFAGMTIYPNPNAGFFTFSAADQNCAEMTIEIVTVEGQVIQTNKYNNVQGNFVQDVDMTQYANGVYIMRVTTDGAVYTNRVVKQD